MDIGIVGGSGYGGAELLRLLAHHPTFKVRTVAAGSQAGRRLDEVWPHLGRDDLLVAAEAGAYLGCALVFLATPHGVSAELAPALIEAGCHVVDLSGAFRLSADDFEAWYGEPHPAARLTPAPYGLPELFGDDLPGAPLVAGPGCYPTAALLALAPLAGLVDPATVVVTGMSGTSGAGAGLRAELHVSHAMNNLGAYGAPRHRHTPEIEGHWAALTGTPAPVTFTPHLVPMPRGLVCTVTAKLLDGDRGEGVHEAYRDRYAGEPFVTVLDQGEWPQTAHVLGANSARIGVAVDARSGRVTASCAIDNLVKGAAGQALQAANIVAGVDETAGLPTVAVYP